MKKWLFGFWVLMCCVSCRNSQDIDSQKDSKLFDLSKYRSYLDTNKYFEPYGRIHKDSSFEILFHRSLDSVSRLKALDMLEDIFQDSSNYYNSPPYSGSYSFYLNSLVFETPDYCGITIDKDTDNGWTTNIKTYFLAYRKGKLIGINEIAGTKGSGWGVIMIDPYKMKSKLINDNVFLVETINLTNEDDSDLLGGFTHIDTLSKLVTFGLNGKLETRTLYEATKPFDKNYHELKSINPLTGHKVTQRLFFYKDK
jgi:hypothetical protein